MAWYKELGFDERIMQKVNAEDSQRQLYIYSVLTLMIITIGLLVTFSSMVYMLIIFHNWPVAIGVGFILGLIIFNIYRLLIVTSVNAAQSGLADYQNNHEKAYQDFIGRFNFRSMSGEKIEEIVYVKKDDLRKIFNLPPQRTNNHFSGLFTMIIRVSFIALFAIIFGTGIELYLFKDILNQTLEQVRMGLESQVPDSFLLKYILMPQEGDSFIFFNCNSLLLLLDTLSASLGYWKLLFDLFFVTLFLIPLVMVFKSKEILKGAYVRELALHEIAISHYHYLETQKFCAGEIYRINSQMDKEVLEFQVGLKEKK